MPKVKLRAATLGGSADEVEVAFYEALQTGDIERLMTCWADEDEIVCVHPADPCVAFVLATNVYHKTAQGWRMVVHHASPGTPADVREAHAATPVFH